MQSLIAGRTRPGFRRRLQHGFTLLEVLMAVGLGSIVIASGSKFVNERVDDVKDQATAQYQKKFATAAERFVNDNLTAIASTLTVNGPPSAINLATIRSAGYLNSGLVATNPYRQTPCLVVRRVNDSSSGTPRLEALVTTEGGMSIPDVRVPFVAAQGGAYGGFVPANAPTTAQGAYGVWSTPLAAYNSVSCSGVSVAQNHLAYALFFDGVGGAVNTDELLHRDVVAGRPDLNTMNTALNMGGFDIVNAANISATNNITAGGMITATDYPSSGYGQTELHRYGLSNQTGNIMILSQAGKNLYLSDWWSKTGTLISQFGRYESLYGTSQFSRTQQVECCNPSGATIGVAEATSSTGRTASINFHNGGVSEGTIELANGGSRRIRFYDSQGQGLGVHADRLDSNTYTATLGETYTGGWFRTTGDGGWYSNKWGGGWHMQDPTWIRAYGDKNVVTGGEVQAGRLTSGSYTSNNNGYFYNVANDWSLVGYAAGGNLNANPTWSWGSLNVNDIYLRSAYGGSGQWLSQALGPTYKSAYIGIPAWDGGFNLSAYLPWPDSANVTAIQVTMTNAMAYNSGVGPLAHVYVDGMDVWTFGFDTTSGNENFSASTTFMLTPGWHNISSSIERGVWSSRSAVITGYFTR